MTPKRAIRLIAIWTVIGLLLSAVVARTQITHSQFSEFAWTSVDVRFSYFSLCIDHIAHAGKLSVEFEFYGNGDGCHGGNCCCGECCNALPMLRPVLPAQPAPDVFIRAGDLI